MKKKVGIFFGGRSVEHEVSVITGLQIIENIDKTKYEPIPVYITKEGKWFTGDSLFKMENFRNNKLNDLKEIIITPRYKDNKIYNHPENLGLFGKKVLDSLDVIFPAIHGTNGEDGTLQGFFELLGIPYVGGGILASSVGMDKIVMKDVFKSYGLPIVDYIWFYRRNWLEDKDSVIREVEKRLQYPVFVKPANLGSSVGITKAKNKEKLIEAIEVAIRYDRKILIEEGIEGAREINCAVIGYDNNVKASLCEEPLGWQELLTYEDKYIKSNTKGVKGDKRIIPAEIPQDMTKTIQELAKGAFTSIDCKGNARVDFLIDGEQKIYVNEINTMPGSIAYYLWEPMGISFKELITSLIDIALKSQEDKEKNMYSYDVDLFKRIGLGSRGKKL